MTKLAPLALVALLSLTAAAQASDDLFDQIASLDPSQLTTPSEDGLDATVTGHRGGNGGGHRGGGNGGGNHGGGRRNFHHNGGGNHNFHNNHRGGNFYFNHGGHHNNHHNNHHNYGGHWNGYWPPVQHAPAPLYVAPVEPVYQGYWGCH
ncbi:hypothetical protein Mal64_32000 [Pseudobythopirellula maris]|uniref:Uncharacterized protein n=1 Tax=Pseudobythopirellula maris TaxID=2527991 RepID=A0A5C5ZKH9_9BACT|nr:hypothetical protein [Pseudobythopirellula maris]TWT87658.1 hypothetical protein Mal64_32000 [Pseudobythopirellula maris]